MGIYLYYNHLSMKQTQRPVFLNLWQIKFPITAIVSILHRISGIVIFLFLPIALYLLAQTLNSPERFTQTLTTLTNCTGLQLALWILLVAVFGHLIAGIRHLLMDVGLGECLTGGRMSAWVVLVATIVLAVLFGIWIWS
jgi:succinate dehydrogenase / fumarate reductase cytochrome b subunit